MRSQPKLLMCVARQLHQRVGGWGLARANDKQRWVRENVRGCRSALGLRIAEHRNDDKG